MASIVAGDSVTLVRWGSSFLLGETGADWYLGYSLTLSALLRTDFFLFKKLFPGPSPILKKI